MWVRIFLAFFLCLELRLVAAEREETISLAQLRRDLTEHVSQKRFEPGTWGIKIVSLDSGSVLFETNAYELLKPASNAKVFTGALALDRLGPDFRIRTSLLSKARPNSSGSLPGDLIVYGRGDPSFAARFRADSYTNQLADMVAAIRNAGIKEIRGDLIGDDTYFSGDAYGSNWTWDDLQYYYGAEVSALSFQDNVIDLFLKPGAAGEPCQLSVKPESNYLEFVNRTQTTATNIRGSISISRPLGERRVFITGTLPRNHGTWIDAVSVPNPALWFVAALRDGLERNGIRVHGQLRVRSFPQDAKLNPADFNEVAFTESQPISEIVAKMLTASQNLYAQLLLLQVGARGKSTPGTTEDAGIAELKAFVKRAGINPNEVLLDEGSGLSRAALVTPNALVSLHQFMARHPRGELFRAALPAPGEGTLRTRFRDLSSANLRAKTGTIRYVNTLSGYMQSKAGERMAFAIMLNAYDRNASGSSRDEIDVIVRALAQLSERSGK